MMLQAAAKPEDDLLSGHQPMHMLLFGDSVDYRIARHLCNISKHQETLEPFGSNPIGQEHNMTGTTPPQRRPACAVSRKHLSMRWCE